MMNQRRIISIVVFFALVGIIIAGVFLGQIVLAFRTNTQGSASLPATQAKDNPIVRENALSGTNSWEIPVDRAATIQIQAYTSATSILPGHKLTFYVSTQQEGTLYSIDIFRLGWYGGAGGRLVLSQYNLIGQAQGYFDPITHLLINCGSCRSDVNTGLIEANWKPSYVLNVPSNWTTGIYLAKFTDEEEKQTYATFDVLGDFHSTYVAVTPDTTYAAYNNWGGYSLYEADNATSNSSEEDIRASSKLLRAVKVSFDRPYVQNYGSSQVLVFEADAIHWMEHQGYDLSYISDVDLHENPAQLLQHRVYLSLGHDEYWTKEMRDGVEYARDHSVGLAFLGSDDSYWQMRFERDSAGNPDRTVVCYKVESKKHLAGGYDLSDLVRDPLYGKDNTRLTSQWRDQIINRPENALIGIMYSGYAQNLLGFPWELNPHANSLLLSGTTLQVGLQYGCKLVGYEWDHVFANGATPPGLQIIGTSPTVNASNVSDFGNTSYYIAHSGAMVFATGSIYWTYALDDYRYGPSDNCVHQPFSIFGMQKLMANIMNALAVHHSSGQLATSSTSTMSVASVNWLASTEMHLQSAIHNLPNRNWTVLMNSFYLDCKIKRIVRHGSKRANLT